MPETPWGSVSEAGATTVIGAIWTASYDNEGQLATWRNAPGSPASANSLPFRLLCDPRH